ncbi:NAD-dependent epimerase/dehydratase family protein [Nonomuraea sediminis]|uniref:NAD-dependent epimerase/dehydratase family protein n=1 Tax=Nonomuraea sediminis TaxID=2835864 RepID=UPI001BDCE598|nr:NAD(P)-dependent oxidoreductase [Nonomuraea sediminis]
MRLTGAVMAHPKRRDAAARLAGDVLDVVTDPDPGGRPSAFRTSLLAWSSVPADSTHHVLLHDDMVLSSGFFERAERAAAALPGAALALFAFWNSRNGAAVRMGALAGARWVPGAAEYTPVAALMLPREVAAGYVEWARDRGDTWPDDVLMGRYLRQAGVPVYVAVPSLAEHEDLASLVDNDFQGLRRSPCFVADDPVTGEDVLPELPVIPFLKRGVAQCAIGGRDVLCEDYLDGLGLSVRGKSQLWITAFTMGVAHEGDLAEAGLVDRALATMGPGGYCHAMGSRELGGRAQAWLAEARDGLEAGLAARPRPAGRGSVTVTGEPGFVRDHLVHALADRGYQVAEGGSSRVRVGASEIVVNDAVVLRLGEVYGPGMPQRGPVAELVLQSSLNRPLRARGPAVQLVHVRDVARAVIAALETGVTGTFDVAGAAPVPLPELAEAVRRAVRPVASQVTSAGEPARVMDVRPAAERLGWRPEVDLDYGIHHYAQWLAYRSDRG